MRVIIVVEGGIVQQVVSTDAPVAYEVLDLDVDGDEPVNHYADVTEVIADAAAFVDEWEKEVL